MVIDKQQVVDHIREQGGEGQAQQAMQTLPDQVDTDQHGNLLQQLGADIQKLMGGFGGGQR